MFAIALAVAIGTYPLIRLLKAPRAIAEGVAAFGRPPVRRVAVRGRDEVGKLALTFNRPRTGSKPRKRAKAAARQRFPRAALAACAAQDGGRGDCGAAPREQREEIARTLPTRRAGGWILLASRLDADAGEAFALQRIDLIGLLAEECAPFDADLTVVPGQSVFVEGDVRLLHRLFRNLLENARRHGGEGPVEVSVACHAPGAVVMVCDRGPGIPEPGRARLFEPFYRLPGLGEHAGGTGLGLSLVRQIAEKHRGEVRYVPREGGGACFQVTLPLATSAGIC